MPSLILDSRAQSAPWRMVAKTFEKFNKKVPLSYKDYLFLGTCETNFVFCNFRNSSRRHTTSVQPPQFNHDGMRGKHIRKEAIFH